MANSSMSVQQIIASLESQQALHREREAHHAAQEAVHREERERHAADLENITQRLEQFRSIAAAAVELAQKARPAAPSHQKEEDYGPASRPRLARMVRRILMEHDPAPTFGANWVVREINRRFGDNLRTRVDVPQVSAVLRRMHDLGELELQRQGRPKHENRYGLRALLRTNR